MTISPIIDPGADLAEPAAGPGDLAGRSSRRHWPRAGSPSSTSGPLIAYNGWTVDGVPGGHVPGAAAFPATWLESLERGEVVERLAANGVRADRPIVVYGASVEDTNRVAERLRADGFEGVRELTRRLVRLAGRSGPAGRVAARLPPAGPSRLAPGGPRRRAPGGGARGSRAPLPRELRRARGVRGGPSARRPLPGHELAGGPGRLEPPLAGGARRRPSGRSASRPTPP